MVKVTEHITQRAGQLLQEQIIAAAKQKLLNDTYLVRFVDFFIHIVLSSLGHIVFHRTRRSQSKEASPFLKVSIPFNYINCF